MSKWTSRKFLLSAAAFLGSIGMSIAALKTDNQAVAVIGVISSMLSAAIYAAMEAIVDAAAVNKDVEIIEEDEDE